MYLITLASKMYETTLQHGPRDGVRVGYRDAPHVIELITQQQSLLAIVQDDD